MDPKGKTALVTGGAVRVGRAITLGLARAGANVVINYNASAQPAEATAAEDACASAKPASAAVNTAPTGPTKRCASVDTKATAVTRAAKSTAVKRLKARPGDGSASARRACQVCTAA